MTGNILMRAKQLLSSFVADEFHSDKEPDVSIHSEDGFDVSQHRSRKAYLKRIRTFSTLTWFCKPAQLSPLACARYGWENQQAELLKCVTCSSILSGHFPESARTQSSGEYIQKLEDGLISGHKLTCPWRSNPTPWWCVHLPLHMPHTLHNIIVDQYADLLQLMMLDRFTTGHLPLPIIASDTLVHETAIELPRFIETCQTVLLVTDRILDEAWQSTSDSDSFLQSIKETALLLAITGWSHSESSSGAVLFCEHCQREAGLWNYEIQEDRRDQQTISHSQLHLVDDICDNGETSEVTTKQSQDNEVSSVSGNQYQESMDASSTESESLSDENRTSDSHSPSMNDVNIDSDTKAESDSLSRPDELWDIDPEINVDFEMLIDESNCERLQDDIDTSCSTEHQPIQDKMASDADDDDDMEMITEQEYSMNDDSTLRPVRTELLETSDAHSVNESNREQDDDENEHPVEQTSSRDTESSSDTSLGEIDCRAQDNIISFDRPEQDHRGKFESLEQDNLRTIDCPHQSSFKSIDDTDIKNIPPTDEQITDDLENTANPTQANLEKSTILRQVDVEKTASPVQANPEKVAIVRQDDLEKVERSIPCNLINKDSPEMGNLEENDSAKQDNFDKTNDHSLNKEESIDIHTKDNHEMIQSNLGKTDSIQQDKTDSHILESLEKTDTCSTQQDNLEATSIHRQDNSEKTNIPCQDSFEKKAAYSDDSLKNGNMEMTNSCKQAYLEEIFVRTQDNLETTNIHSDNNLSSVNILDQDNFEKTDCPIQDKFGMMDSQDNLENTTYHTQDDAEKSALSTQDISENTDSSSHDNLEKNESHSQSKSENTDSSIHGSLEKTGPSYVNSEKTDIPSQGNLEKTDSPSQGTLERTDIPSHGNLNNIISNFKGANNACLDNLSTIDICDENNLKDAKTLTEIDCTDKLNTVGCKDQFKDMETLQCESFKDDSSLENVVQTCSLEENVCVHDEIEKKADYLDTDIMIGKTNVPVHIATLEYSHLVRANISPNSENLDNLAKDITDGSANLGEQDDEVNVGNNSPCQDDVSSKVSFSANIDQHANNVHACQDNKSAVLPSSQCSRVQHGKRKAMAAGEEDELGTEAPHRKLVKLDATVSHYSIQKSPFDPIKEHKSWCPWLTHSKLPCQDQNHFDKHRLDTPTQISSNGHHEESTSPGIKNQQMETSRVEESCKHSGNDAFSEITDLKQPLTPVSNASDVMSNECYMERTYPGWKLALIVLNLWRPDHGLLDRSPPRIMQKPQADGLRYVRRILRDWPSSVNSDTT